MGILTHDDGFYPTNPQEASDAQATGYLPCYTQKNSHSSTGGPCNFMLAPDTQEAVKDTMGGYYTCPSCQQSHDLLHELPWHGVPDDEYNPAAQNEFNAGGGTRIGLPMAEQSQIGEDLVKNLGEIPGYGPITWWHEGTAITQAPLDGATEDWGIEVKTLGYDALHHRFIPGRAVEKAHKNQMALQMGKKGVLGVLVILDYRRSVADIYAQEYPVMTDEQGAVTKGVGAFRSRSGMHLVKEVPFKNPLMDPHSPTPVANQEPGANYANDGSAMAF